jgi:putative DNA primase/helicase
MSSATERDTDLLRFYDNEGIKLVRLSHKTKKPVDTEWQHRPLAVEDAEEWVRGGGDVGWQCGEVSGWMSAIDLDCEEARRLAPRFLPETLRGAKGKETPSQYFYRSTELGYKKFSELDGPSELIALKASNNGRGHQVAVAPSIHRGKGPYHFVGGYNPAAIAVVDKDKLRHHVGMLAAAALIAQLLPPSKDEGGGGRHDLALALAGYMLRNGEAVEDVEEILVAAWELRRAPHQGVEDVRRSVRDTAAQLARDEPATGGRRLGELVSRMPEKIADFLGWERADLREQRRHYMRTDLGNAERFIDAHRDRVLWCPARKSFLCWDGKRYTWDERGEVVKLAHQTARSIFHEAAAAEGEEEQKAITKWALASQNESRVSAMLSQARPYLAVGMEELDRDPWLTNCQNGTLDLRTGRLKDHDPADRITKIVPEDYDPNASCPRFLRFLKESLVDDAVIKFVKRYSGYTLTGITRERLLAILYGFGKNGKTTLVELLHEVLGDYARNTDVETLLIKKYQGVGNDVAALKGARFVSAAEVEKGRRLAESKVKQLTGRDTVTARFLFGENFDFKPEFKLWLSTNNKPVIQGTDDAIWDRIRLIPFTQRFEGSKADPKLPDKLRDELAGVLAWMVEGCLEWQEHGLEEPKTVADATKQYREEMDTLAAFFEDRCVIREGLLTPASRLYKQYQMWCDDAGENAETQKMFGMRLSERGFVSEKIKRGQHKDRKGWRGIGLRADDPEPEDPDDGDNIPPDGAPGAGHRPHSGPSADDRPRGQDAGFAGTSARASGRADHSGPKNQYPPYADPRVEKDSEIRSASSASSAQQERSAVVKDVVELANDPPHWLRAQADKHLENPTERTLNPLCTAVAARLYGDPARWREVKPAVADWLGKVSA